MLYITKNAEQTFHMSYKILVNLHCWMTKSRGYLGLPWQKVDSIFTGRCDAWGSLCPMFMTVLQWARPPHRCMFLACLLFCLLWLRLWLSWTPWASPELLGMQTLHMRSPIPPWQFMAWRELELNSGWLIIGCLQPSLHK